MRVAGYTFSPAEPGKTSLRGSLPRAASESPEAVCGRSGGEGARAGARDAAAALRPGGRGGGERALGARRAPQ